MARFKTDVCDPAGCFYELVIQLGIIMVGKQAFNNIIEFLVPTLKSWWKRYVYRHAVEDSEEKKVFTRWELDYNLVGVDRLALLDEYLEMGANLYTILVFSLNF